MPHILIFIGAVLVAIGGIWSANQQNNFEKELRLKNELTVASIQETLKMVTGGDSYPYVDFSFNNSQSISPMLVNSGNYPLYDVSIRVVDVDLLQEQGAAAHDLLRLDFGNINPSSTTANTELRINLLPPAAESKAFNIFISTRNGFYIENYNIKKISGHWLKAYRVRENMPGRERQLREWSDADYPRNAESQIEWLE